MSAVPRLNMIVIILMPFLFIGLIKLMNSVLPEKYYFSFSALVKNGEQPFIIAQPGVSSKKLCALLKKYGISIKDYGYSLTCDYDAKLKKMESIKNWPLPIEVKDKIYKNFLNDKAVELVKIQLSKRKIENITLSDEAIESIISYEPTVNKTITALTSTLSSNLLSGFSELLFNANKIALGQYLYAGIVKEKTLSGDGTQEKEITTEQQKELISSFNSFQESLVPVEVAKALQGLEKSDIDEILKQLERWDADRETMLRQLADRYLDPVEKEIDKRFRLALASRGFKLQTPENLKSVVGQEIAWESAGDYIIAGFLRLLPILLGAALVGAWLGRQEILSIGIAAGIAALLLCWPIFLLWDTVVTGNWNAYRGLFAAFYLGYIFVFFLTGHAGATAGVYVRQHFEGRSADPQAGDGGIFGQLKLQRVGLELALSVIGNVIMLLWNVAIPLQVAS